MTDPGQAPEYEADPDLDTLENICPRCKGLGRNQYEDYGDPCPVCNGEGYLT